MKKATLLAISFMIIAVTCMSFSSSSVDNTASPVKKPLTQATFYYKPGVEYQRLEPGHDYEFDLFEQTIAEFNFTDPNRWSTTDTYPMWPGTDMNAYIYYITFDHEWYADGSSDGQLTLQEALNRLWYEFSHQGAMPQSTRIDPYVYSYINVYSCPGSRY